MLLALNSNGCTQYTEKKKKIQPTNKRKSSQKTRGPCFLPQTQKHVHNIRKKISLQIKQGMRQTMPHVYKISEHPTDKGYKEEEKNSQKKKKG